MGSMNLKNICSDQILNLHVTLLIQVLMVTEETYRPYMRPPLSKELWFDGAIPEDLKYTNWAKKTSRFVIELKNFHLVSIQ